MDLRQIADDVIQEMVSNKVASTKPAVLALVGLQYSGKSYLADLITNKNYAHFWATKIKKEYEIKNPELIELAGLVINLLAERKINVVIDFVNHKYADRKKLQESALAAGTEYRLIFVDTPKEVRMQRREENIAIGNQPGRRAISLEQMEEFESDFEIPRNDESVTILRSQADINRFLASL